MVSKPSLRSDFDGGPVEGVPRIGRAAPAVRSLLIWAGRVKGSRTRQIWLFARAKPLYWRLTGVLHAESARPAGHAIMPERPGHGMIWNAEAVERYRMR